MEKSLAEEHGTWRLEAREGLWVVLCGPLEQVPGIGHAFATRRELGSGPDGIDYGPAEAASAEVWRARRRLFRAAGLASDQALVPLQEHGAVVLRAEACRGTLRGDALVCLRPSGPSPVLCVRTADCVPLLLASADGDAVATIHAGWRGIVAGIVPRAVAQLAELGVERAALRAAIGPSIGRCCYEVGAAVLDAVADPRRGGVAQPPHRSRSGRPSLDLAGAVEAQLVAAGLAAGSIWSTPWCTACRDDLFFSYRRQGAGAGRMMAVIGWSSAVA